MIQSTQHSNIQQQTAPGFFPSARPHLARWFVWEQALLLALTVSFWCAYLALQTSVVGFGHSRDFLGIYVGARAVATGNGSQLYDVQFQRTLMDVATLPYHRGKLMPFTYPAYVALLFRPLGSLTYGTALLVWMLINLAMAIWMAIQLSYWFAGDLTGRLAILATCFAWVPLQLTVFQGQLGILPTIGIFQALISLRSGHEWRGGWWLSLGLLKPQLVLFPLLAFLLWRCWRTVLAFFMALVGILGISIAALGFWITRYVRFLAEYNRLGPDLSLYPSAMQNWRGLVSVLVGTDNGLASRSVLLVLSAVSILVVIIICYPRSSGRLSELDIRFSAIGRDSRYATAVLLGLLSSPHLYMHDWVVALPAGFMLWSFAREPHSEACSKNRFRVALLWLLALAPVVFLAAQFIWSQLHTIQLVPVYIAVVVAVAVALLGPFRGLPEAK